MAKICTQQDVLALKNNNNLHNAITATKDLKGIFVIYAKLFVVTFELTNALTPNDGSALS